MILSVVPTVTGREDSLRRTLDSLGESVNLIYLGRPTCGEAWADGGRSAWELGADYVWFAADDVEVHEGFFPAMVEAVDAGKHPASVVLEPDGALQSCGGRAWDCCKAHCADWTEVDWSPTPFIHRDWWPLLEPHAKTLCDLHYASDLLVSEVLKREGIPSVVRTPAVLTHYNHPVGRGAGSDQHERTARDRAVFDRWRDSL